MWWHRYHKDCKRDFFLKIKDLDDTEEERDVYLSEVINTVSLHLELC